MIKSIKNLNWVMVVALLIFLFFSKLVYWDYFVLIFGKAGTIKIYILAAVVLLIFFILDLIVLEPRRRKKEFLSSLVISIDLTSMSGKVKD